MSHFGFVLTSYCIAGLALFAIIGWILIDQRILKNELKRLEAQGVRRRSVKAAEQSQ